MNAEELKKEIKKIKSLMHSFQDYGATDSEPMWYLNSLLSRAVKGKPMPVITLTSWDLYESEPGWEDAAKALTEEATRVYVLIQSSPLIEVKQIESILD